MKHNCNISGHETNLCFYGIKDSASIQLRFTYFLLF